jgi:tetraacyldisaccharide 4'-kinase
MLYGTIARMRLSRGGRRAVAPVVCIGNPTVGGAGKTPMALAVARMLREAGEQPIFLTRGYGGALAGPVLVEPKQHFALDVGDEPLLLAGVAPTVVARDRVAGARSAVAAGATVIVMDDGFQNPGLHKDVSLLVVDERRGIGNGRVIPAGPLRVPLAAQLARAHAFVAVGAPSGAAEVRAQARKCNLPVFQAHLQPEKDFIAALGPGRVLAFAGIGDPEKFFTSLSDAGISVAATQSFPDHHRYTRAQAQALCKQAADDGLILVTTEKDLARMRGDDEVAELAAHAHALPVALVLDERQAFKAFLLDRVAATKASCRSRSS